MKPIEFSQFVPNDVYSNFPVDWKSLVLSGLEMETEVGYRYLEEIKTYCNNGGMPDGICGKVFEYRQDSEFEKLLSNIHDLGDLERNFIPYLFSKTAIKDFLKEFSEDETELQKALFDCDFGYLNAGIEQELSDYLFRYGMYSHFYQNKNEKDAKEISIRFMQQLFENDLNNVVCFYANGPWGKWFDIHSCTDRTFVFINKKERMIYLFCFSHSD